MGGTRLPEPTAWAMLDTVAARHPGRQALVFGHALPMPVVIRSQELTHDYQAGASLRQRLDPAPAGANGQRKQGLFG